MLKWISVTRRLVLTSSGKYHSILSKHETFVKDPHPNISKVNFNTFAANSPTEDRHSEFYHPYASFFGVYDGHGGTAAAQFAQDHLIHYCRYMMSQNQNVTEALKSAFQKADKDFLTGCLLDRKKFKDGISGACVALSVVMENTLYVANAGDCRVVLGKRGKGNSWEAIPLSRDHTATSERERLMSEHPNEPDVVTRGRVKGDLIPSRGIGDGLFKVPEFNRIFKAYKFHEPPYTTAVPEVTVHPLTSEDAFVVMGTDGLWDDCDNEQVVQIVGDYLNRDENVCSALIKRALVNAYKLQSFPKRPEEEIVKMMVNIPNYYKREFHDDITITVIYLKESKDQFEGVWNEKVEPPAIHLEIQARLQRG
jgi:pyruvate dehydrogenase phosphatase